MNSKKEPVELQKLLPNIKENSEKILFAWCECEATASLIKHCKRDNQEVIDTIGTLILQYTYELIMHKSSPSSQYVEKLALHFDTCHIEINQVFLTYMDLRREARRFLFENLDSDKTSTRKILHDFSTIFDINLASVLDIYFKMQLQKIQREQENVLRERKLLDDYKKIVDVINGVVITDEKGIITYVNEVYCNFSGYDASHFIGKTFELISNEKNSSEIYKEMYQAINEDNLWRGTIHNQRKDGSVYYVDATITPIRNRDNTITEYISLQRDISKEILQEIELRQMRDKDENQRLDTIIHQKIDKLLNVIPMGTFILSEENIIIDYNELFLSHFDPFDQQEIHNNLIQNKLTLTSILTHTSKVEFENYPSLWLDMYNEIYAEVPLQIECMGDISNEIYNLRITLLEEENHALVCIEKA